MPFAALQCKDCHYFYGAPTLPENPCNRFPLPVRVKATYWCGEWKQKEIE